MKSSFSIDIPKELHEEMKKVIPRGELTPTVVKFLTKLVAETKESIYVPSHIIHGGKTIEFVSRTGHTK